MFKKRRKKKKAQIIDFRETTSLDLYEHLNTLNQRYHRHYISVGFLTVLRPQEEKASTTIPAHHIVPDCK